MVTTPRKWWVFVLRVGGRACYQRLTYNRGWSHVHLNGAFKLGIWIGHMQPTCPHCRFYSSAPFVPCVCVQGDYLPFVSLRSWPMAVCECILWCRGSSPLSATLARPTGCMRTLHGVKRT